MQALRDKDLNSPRILSAEAEKVLQWVENRILDVHVDRINLDLDCILVILPSKEYPSGILVQKEDTILGWIFLPHKQNKKLKTYIEKISDLILKGKLRLHRLTGKDPAEIIVPLTNDEISSLWKDNEYWQITLTDFLGTISNNYPKTDRIKFIKKTVWILPRIVRQTPISGVLTFYTDANKSGKLTSRSQRTLYGWILKGKKVAITIKQKEHVIRLAAEVIMKPLWYDGKRRVRSRRSDCDSNLCRFI
ncbi:HERV-K-3q27.3 provirus ancestral Pol protein [Cricetulus griseus]|nr:HERV-K-3q27.3 provirus ancestral Pol protein [Cricetulus griseus]